MKLESQRFNYKDRFLSCYQTYILLYILLEEPRATAKTYITFIGYLHSIAYILCKVLSLKTTTTKPFQCNCKVHIGAYIVYCYNQVAFSIYTKLDISSP